MSKPHPIQPVETDAGGTLRFKANAIVRWLLDAGPFNMNQIAVSNFSREDREQFAQLIGYSVSGAGDLDYMSSEVIDAAYGMAAGVNELEARNDVLRSNLAAIKDGIRDAVARLYNIAPEDLMEEGPDV